MTSLYSAVALARLNWALNIVCVPREHGRASRRGKSAPRPVYRNSRRRAILDGVQLRIEYIGAPVVICGCCCC